ncbi:PAS domain-containing sensor histidine kinase [Achromobacter aloeverae]|uniref:Histidine kinase n=1 Tax=Achromobacter aloeverae TaxID=1750518 RepID=A0A4Q1HCR5_9BURK|nr:PAS domain-containing sensor histidine kinase [Achromobacter aloeverae]RXN83394.1 histidine kinase [Achromobacter aloeverae]
MPPVLPSLLLALACIAVGFLAARLRQRRGAGADKPASPAPGEARLYGIIQSAMEAIITVDASQTIVIFNPAAERIFLCPATEAIGTSLNRFIPQRFRHTHPRDLARFGRTGVSERQMGGDRKVTGLRANGEEFPLEASISQWEDEHGKLYTVQLRDVTERERANQELEASRNELTRLSTAIQNIREEEKAHIARELHDDLGQSLTAMKMGLSLLEGMLPADATPARAQAASLHALINATVGSVRRIASSLRPVMLDDLGLFAAVEWLAQDFNERYAIETDVHISGEQIELGHALTTAVFRIVQEAFTNTARHAGASRISLRLECDPQSCRLDIRDNGVGATPTQMAKVESFGLLGIRERVRLLGGTLSVHSEPAQGFHLVATLPITTDTVEETS